MRAVSIVIPVFNAELTLQKLVRQLTEAMPAVSENFEIILVDDCLQSTMVFKEHAVDLGLAENVTG